MAMLLHATTISLNGHGVVLQGPPGSGKSDLALRLLECASADFLGTPMSAALVADDQTEIENRNGIMWASPPKALAGLWEVRGLGIIRVPHVAKVPLVLVVQLKDQSAIERLPEPETLKTVLAGLTVATCQVDPRLPGATAKVKLALLHALGLAKSL
jgi:HPr kinase/phosphorylase